MDDQGQHYERLQNWNGRSSLAGIVLPGCDLTEVYLENAKLMGANLAGSTIRTGNLSGADLTDANLENCDLAYANMENVTLIRTRLGGTNLKNTSLKGAIAKEACFNEATLWEANLQNACLNKASLVGAHIHMCDMHQASFWKANIQQAFMKEARLINANLTEIDGRGCRLIDVDFTGAYVWRGNFLDAQGNFIEPLLNAQIRGGCILPDGSRFEAQHISGFISLKVGGTFRGERAHRHIQMLAGEIWLTFPDGTDITLEAGQLLDFRQGADLLITALGDEDAIFILS